MANEKQKRKRKTICNHILNLFSRLLKLVRSIFIRIVLNRLFVFYTLYRVTHFLKSHSTFNIRHRVHSRNLQESCFKKASSSIQTGKIHIFPICTTSSGTFNFVIKFSGGHFGEGKSGNQQVFEKVVFTENDEFRLVLVEIAFCRNSVQTDKKNSLKLIYDHIIYFGYEIVFWFENESRNSNWIIFY
jgi:hypothetical protein